MNWKLCVLLLLCAVIVSVQSESYIEVDEDGNEYEVKRFHIQGRQLDSSDQQCVVTRRRRSTNTDNTGRQYGNPDPVFTLTQETEDDSYDKMDGEDNQEEDESKDEIAYIGGVNNANKIIDKPTDAGVLLDDMKFDIKDEDDVKVTEISEKPAAVKEPMAEKETQNLQEMTIIIDNKKPKKTEKLKRVTLIRPEVIDKKEKEMEMAMEKEEEKEKEEHKQEPAIQSIQFLPSSLVSSTAANNFVFIQAPNSQISKVPTISAKPVLSVLPSDADYELESELFPISWSYETQPASTTAIWSTGEDVPNNVFNRINDLDDPDYPSSSELEEEDENEDQLEESSPAPTSRPRPRPRPTKKNKRKKKKKKNKKNKNKKDKRGPTRRPNRNRPNKKRKNQNAQVVRRKHYYAGGKPVANNNRRRTSNKPSQNQRGQQGNNNNTKQTKKKTKPGAVTTTTTLTTTEDNDANIECIIINKDKPVTSTTSTTTTTTTTRRPFWNILGRRVAEQPRNNEYGLRKRTGLRFVA